MAPTDEASFLLNFQRGALEFHFTTRKTEANIDRNLGTLSRRSRWRDPPAKRAYLQVALDALGGRYRPDRSF